MHRRIVRFVALVVSALAVAAVAFAARGPLSRSAVSAAIELATGYRVAFESLDLRADGATARRVTVARGGDRLLEAERVGVRYRLRDLFPGGTRRFGFEAIALDRPRVTLVRRADGSFASLGPLGVPVLQAPVAAGAVTLVPLRFTVTLDDGRIELDDRFRRLPEARRLVIGAIRGTLSVDSASRSTYHLRGDLGADPRQTLALDGRFGDAFALHRLRGDRLDLVPLLNYVVDTSAARFERATGRHADLRLYGFSRTPGAPITYHLAGSIELAGGRMRVPGLVPSATALRGRIDLFDGGLAAPSLAGRIADVPVRLAGGLLDWGHPAFRLGIDARTAALERLRGLFAFSRDLPLTGAASLSTLLEGPVASPLVAMRVAAPRVEYRLFHGTALGARAFYYDGGVDLIGLHAVAGGATLGVDGTIALGTVAFSRLAVSAARSTEGLPYAAEFAPGMTARAVAIVAGRGLELHARGTLDGDGGGVTAEEAFARGTRGLCHIGLIAL
ncbi:MAG: hypothetical protein NVSMB21_04580 [Vulcanimicrobiaceae bacterium]